MNQYHIIHPGNDGAKLQVLMSSDSPNTLGFSLASRHSFSTDEADLAVRYAKELAGCDGCTFIPEIIAA